MSYEAQQVCFYEYDHQLKNLANGVTITSCVVSSVSFLLKCCDSQSFVFPGRMATAATFLSVLFSFTLLITTATDFKQLDPSSDQVYQDLCTAQGIIFQFLAVAITIHWTFVGLVTYLVVVVRYPLRNFVILERYFNLLCWSTSAALTFIPIAVRGIDVYGPNSAITSCYFQHINDQFYYFYSQMILNLLIGSYFTVRIVVRLLHLARSEDFFAGRKFKIRSCIIRWCMAVRACFCNDPHEPSDETPEHEPFDDGMFSEIHDEPLSGDYDSPGNSLQQRRSQSRASQQSITSKSSKHVLATVMRYHLLRHVLFMLMFMFVFVATFLDAINRKISARESDGSLDPQDTLDHRFTKQHPCATAFVGIFASSGVGLLVGLAFLRRPNCAFSSPLGAIAGGSAMISIPEKEQEEEDGEYYLKSDDDQELSRENGLI